MSTSRIIVSTIFLLGTLSLVKADYPAHYEVGYGFVNHGGVGPHGHYLPAVARVKVHKDPFTSSYSLDEEGPTHYKYIRQTSSTVHHPPPIVPVVDHHIHHGLEHGHGHHHHHHAHPIGVAAPLPVPIHGGVITEVPSPNLAVPAPNYGHYGEHFGGYYDGYGYEGYPYY